MGEQARVDSCEKQSCLTPKASLPQKLCFACAAPPSDCAQCLQDAFDSSLQTPVARSLLSEVTRGDLSVEAETGESYVLVFVTSLDAPASTAFSYGLDASNDPAGSPHVLQQEAFFSAWGH